MNEERKVISVQSVSKARRATLKNSNSYVGKYGEILWTVALLTAYQNGGVKELMDNYNNVPMRYVNLLLDAYRYKNAEQEFMMTQAAAYPNMKKADSKKHMEDLQNRLEGRK